MDEAVILNPCFDEGEEYHDAREDTEIQKGVFKAQIMLHNTTIVAKDKQVKP